MWTNRILATLVSVCISLAATACSGPDDPASPITQGPSARSDGNLRIVPYKLVFASAGSRTRTAKVYEVGGTFADACSPNGIAAVAVGPGKNGVTPVRVTPEHHGKCLVYFLNLAGTKGGYLHVRVR